MIPTILTDVIDSTVEQFKFALRRGRLETSLWERGVFYVAVGLIIFLSLFPLYIMVITSIMPPQSLYSLPVKFFPTEITAEHYAYILTSDRFPFLRFFYNSFIVAIVTATLSIIFATLGGYSVSRLDFPGRSLAVRLVLIVYLFAGIILIVPLFQILSFYGLVDTLSGLMLANLVVTLPLALYMLGNYFRSIPPEIEEAALMDGYSRLETIFRITIPLSAPALVAVFLFTFLSAWNEYLFASIFLRSTVKFTLPIGIEALQLSESGDVWGRIMAASMVTSLPVIIMFLYLEKWMIEGLTVGGVEG